MTAQAIASRLGDLQREGRGFRCHYPLHGGKSLMLRDARDHQHIA